MSHLIFKRRIGYIWPKKLYNRKIILLYHSVGDNLWAMPKKNFLDQINWISDYCHILNLSELIKSKSDNNIQVSITFDDGYASLYHQVIPFLKEKKINATVYINTGWIGKN